MLLTEFGPENRVLNTGLDISYGVTHKVAMVSMLSNDVPVSVQQWYSVVYRYATKSYDYVGMTYETAKQCKDSMKDKYTRGFRNQTSYYHQFALFDEQNVEAIECQTQIALTHQAGTMYDVNINVNEQDSVVVNATYAPPSGSTLPTIDWNLPDDLGTLFSYITCDYDDDEYVPPSTWTFTPDPTDPSKDSRRFSLTEKASKNQVVYTLSMGGVAQSQVYRANSVDSLTMAYGDTPQAKDYTVTAIRSTNS